MYKNIAVLVFLGFSLLALTGCDDNKPPKSTIVKFAQPQATEAAKGQELGDGIRVKFITATGGHEKMQAEVQRQLGAFINSGQYEIVQVSTTRCNGSEAHLLSAEVYYRPKK